MAKLAPAHDVTMDDPAKDFRLYLSAYRRCSLCVTPAIIRKQVHEQWNRAVEEDRPFTVDEIRQIAVMRCGDCSHQHWPKISLVENCIFLHLASSDRRKLRLK